MDPSYSTNRRRTTLGLIDPSNNQTYIPTAIPALASAIKKPTQYSMQPPSTVQRMSMGGPRMSLGPSRSVRPNNNGGDVVMGGMGNSLPSQLQQASYPPPGTVQAQRMGDRLSQGNGGRQNGYGVTPARQMGYGMTPGQSFPGSLQVPLQQAGPRLRLAEEEVRGGGALLDEGNEVGNAASCSEDDFKL
ncbi:hypothetical protein BC936DRAFT_140662 [Jimgerdemannia flammicorona]|uniref:Uncharacterized protein n=1 Tax=Jimgerdemannia flammicorona TaxID=994334 RepID=A0A433AGG2_9FUNG|nr:hypothetical protein BC936DRAFT_140662 [Jimgerdemannia flammicorona]